MPFEVTEQNLNALDPLFQPWEEPTLHRARNPQPGQPALIQPGRRPSRCALVPGIRAEVDTWRRGGYGGVSETSCALLHHWFLTEHEVAANGDQCQPFRYHWAQREAIETIIYLYELRRLAGLAALLGEFGGERMAARALAIPPEEDRWPKQCFRIATGVGKTKAMTLAIVWSYFHALYEADSSLPQHFVVIAPNLTVYERLKDDFEHCAIFERDPLIPDEWRPDFQMSVILQDAPGGASTRGAIYLTNIHRLYEGRDREAVEDIGGILGPAVSRAQALDTGAALRERIASHPRLMVINDEAHHLHDPDLAWNRALATLHSQSLARGRQGIVLQLDFSATPKHSDDGSFFDHIVCDFPLGEAVDAGIVKVPVIGESSALEPHGDSRMPAHERYAAHLQLGYQRYAHSYAQLAGSRKPILFVMTEDTQAANEIAAHLNDNDAFPLLKGRVLNVHTHVKGRVRTYMRNGREVKEFVEREERIKPDDLRALREMSRELDRPESRYRCVVSVMMLREGWDVRNVTTIVPLRPYSAASQILPEQTLGRGLRRMFPLQDVREALIVVHHPAFRDLYAHELEQEGLDIGHMPAEKTVSESVTIFVDHERKPVSALDIVIPRLTDAVQVSTELGELTLDDVREYFDSRFRVLPIGAPQQEPIEYTERHLFTDEVVARMHLDAGLLASAWSAPSYYAQMIGRACGLANPHAALTPLIEGFLAEVLFERPVNLYGGEVDHRMQDADVLEHVRATFTPLVLSRIVRKSQRRRSSQGQALSSWRNYQATSSAKHPALPASRTLFNLAPCANDFEQAFVDFCDYASDIVAFAKNAGPQKLLLDYIKPDGHKGHYIPDFFVRAADGTHYLVETKGREDPAVPIKARAAEEWCQVASRAGAPWRYLYVPYLLFQHSAATSIVELARACAPSLADLLHEAKTAQLALPLEEAQAAKQVEDVFARALRQAGLTIAPTGLEQAMRQAVALLDHAERAAMPDLAHAFQPLLASLDELALRILRERLLSCIPSDPRRIHDYFDPYLEDLPAASRGQLSRNQRSLERNLVYGQQFMLLGTLLFCVDYALNWTIVAPGVWTDVRERFSGAATQALYDDLVQVNAFRNTRVAHVEKRLTDATEAWATLATWLRCLDAMAQMAAL